MVLSLLLGWFAAAAAPAPVALKAGMVITRSITVKPGTYRLAASADLKTPALVVRGNNVTIDFNGAVLAGSADLADPDTMAGVGILIDGGSKVTLKNAVVRGYKVGVMARNAPDLRITNGDFSYNWKQRLHSGIEKESLVDWMSYHQNEKDEWLRYGAAIYLRGCDRALIDNNTATQGQNGLMVTSSTGLRIWNNTFQYLSSIGVGLYRVTDSQIKHNRIDWCVRGYSHGIYNRGQDSAGLLMYEQSSRNIVAFNSITHGGDGLFLWAGQSTMDTGKGGASDNVFYDNDFSHAPTNGIEATFSSNTFIKNRVEECWHGVWGGYSFDSVWRDNRFARNVEAVAIEHGQNNTIEGNTFDRDETAIRLWQNASQDPSWGYAKTRDTRSHDYRIEGNEFRGNKTALDIRDTAVVAVRNNTFDRVTTTVTLAGETPAFAVGTTTTESVRRTTLLPEPFGDGINAKLEDSARRGRETIIVDEWGPYDWKSPKLWPVVDQPGLKGPDYNVRGPLQLRVLGPAGEWKVASVRGATASPMIGKVGEVITVVPERTVRSAEPQLRGDSPVDYDVALEYRGASVVSPRGAKTAAGQPYTFHYTTFFVPIDWRIKFFEYTDAADPVKQPEAFATLLAGTPLKEVTRDRLDYMSGRTFEDGVARDKFAFLAEADVDLPPGDYTVTVISDDGVKIWVDGELVLDGWTVHESKVDTLALPGGKRRIKVHYFEGGGFAEMRFDVQRK